MYSSRIIKTTDPDQHVALVRPIGRDLTVTGRGPFRACNTLFDLRRVYAQRGFETLARVARTDLRRSSVLFLTEPGPSMFFNGAEIGINQIGVACAGETYFSRLTGPTRWGAVTVSQHDLHALCETDPNLRQRISGVTVITPPEAALTHLRSLHNYMGHLVEIAPEALNDTVLGHALEHSLMMALRQVLSTYASRTPAPMRTFRALVLVRRFHALTQTQTPGLLRVSEMDLGASARTFRNACQELLGVSPQQYVMLRRMQVARRALLNGDPAADRVTDIATECGFWELGRFSVNYRHLFGESPSATLKGHGRSAH
jgi:AraC-like DNA-binding protein